MATKDKIVNLEDLKAVHDIDAAAVSTLSAAYNASNKRAARDLTIATGHSVTNWVPGYIQTGNPGTVIDPDTVVADENYKCCVLDVVAGEQIFVCGNGGDKEHKLMVVLDSTNKIIAVSPNNAAWDADGSAYTIPNNGVKLVCNARAEYYANVYKNTKAVERIADLEETANTYLNYNLPDRVSALEKADDFDLSASKSIVLLGDSITQGVGSSDYSPTGEDIDVSVHPTKRNVGVKCWGNMFVSLMTERYGCSCINNGVSEFTMQDLLNNLNVLLPDNTDYVILMIGTNNRGNSVSDYETRMSNLITGILNRGARPFVFSTVPYNGSNDPMALKQQITQKVCRAKKVPFFPMYSEIESYINTAGAALSTLYADTLHPNDRGYEVMFGIFRKLLKV